jgi:hypothetical protein
MQLVYKQRIGKHASSTIELLVETACSIRPVQSSYKEVNWCNQFSLAQKGRMRRDGYPVQLRSESPAGKKGFSCKSGAVKRRLYVRCSYSETAIESVARIRLAKTEKA